MQRTFRTLILTGVIAFGFFTDNAQSATLLGDYLKDKGVEVEVSAAVDFYDKYMWRGFILDKDNVVQPSVTISVAGFEGGFWGSWDMESQDGLASDEVDGWIGYNFDLEFIDEALKIVGLSVGHTWYAFPEIDSYTNELYVGVSLDTFLSPYFTWYHDYGDESHGGADGNYYMIGGSHSITLNEEYGVTLDLAEEIGFNNDAFIVGEGGYTLTTVGVTVPLTDNVTFSPIIAYSSPWGDLDDGGGNDQNDEFYGGFSLAFSM